MTHQPAIGDQLRRLARWRASETVFWLLAVAMIFLFPNRYNIYFHDTPAKTLFSSEQRAFSHGCIRLQKPVELAKFLLKDLPAWDDARIDSAMNQQKEQWVTLLSARPVYVVYFTSWVDQEGILNFRNDIYEHDKRMADHLFK